MHDNGMGEGSKYNERERWRWRLTATNLAVSLVARGGRSGQRTVEGAEHRIGGEEDDDSAVAGHPASRRTEIDHGRDHPSICMIEMP